MENKNIVTGKPTDLKHLYKIQHNGYFTSEWLENLWGMGQIQIAQAVPETYRYVAGYVTKKMYEIDGVKANAYYELGQAKPFACMSLKPGLGDHYYQEPRIVTGKHLATTEKFPTREAAEERINATDWNLVGAMIYACKEADEYERKLKRFAKKILTVLKRRTKPWQYKKISVKIPLATIIK